MNILIIDDEIDTLNSLDNILKPTHYNCKFTTNPLDAILLCREGGIDLLITDLKMEALNGIDLIKTIRNFNTKINMIIVSAYCSPDIERSLINYNIFAFFKKPINIKEFIHTIRKIDIQKQPNE